MEKRYQSVVNSDIESLDINSINKDLFDSYNFRTENSKDINIKLLRIADKIKRHIAINDLLSLIMNIDIVVEIEKGIFEFALLHVVTNGLEYKMVENVYQDKVYDIIYNIKDKNNDTLLKSIISGNMLPYAIAFLSPQQLNPSIWRTLLDKKRYIQEAETNMATTDRYKCRKCGERKANVTELQIRSADEPTSLFVTCLVCYNTFII